MKTKLLLLLLLSAFKLTTFAQNKVVKYCVVQAEPKAFSRDWEIVTVKLSMGKVDSLFNFKTPNMKNQLQKVTSFDNRPDVLNYMSSIGWSLVTISAGDRFYFKKEFDPSELSSTTTP